MVPPLLPSWVFSAVPHHLRETQILVTKGTWNSLDSLPAVEIGVPCSNIGGSFESQQEEAPAWWGFSVTNSLGFKRPSEQLCFSGWQGGCEEGAFEKRANKLE